VGFDFVVEKKLHYYGFILGLTLLLVILDYLNPFVNFYKTWNMHYVMNNLGWFMIFLVPIFFILGIAAEWYDSSDLFFASVLIPVYYYILKGFLFLFLIAQDPNLPHVIGVWYGGYILDWRDFSVIYFSSLPLYMLFVWRYSFGFLALGYITGHLLSRRIVRIVKPILRRIARRFGSDVEKVLVS
jgi:hypothetical protein